MKCNERLARERCVMWLAEYLKGKGIPTLCMEGAEEIAVKEANADAAFALSVDYLHQRGWIVEMMQPRNGFTYLTPEPANEHAMELL